MDVCILLQQLKDHESLSRLSLGTIMTFITWASALKRDIIQPQPLSTPVDRAPEFLPPSVSCFLGDSTDIPQEYIQDCWTIFKDVVWDHPNTEDTKRADVEAFKVHGQKQGLSVCISIL
jgi:hypothetical protein